jgi:LuxR family transcriptional regulator, maltose regulon positive regulatory protein
MPTPILATKLYIPPSRPKAVLRPRLIERLNEGLRQSRGFGRKLTLISAPAGFGKTTLVSEWVSERMKAEGLPLTKTAWLSLDPGDNNLVRFLTYLIAALQTISANIGAGLLNALQTPQPPSIESVLTALLNEITAIPDRFVLVLDDYHLIDAKPVDDVLAFLLEHLPPQMHLVIATREDPSLPLARLRARGHLTELRAADLRFTPAEAADFLNQVMGLNLSAENIAALETRTEGWIAGLQLAALSMQGHQDVSGFIQEFAGDHRYVVDYLVEEVLQRQSEPLRNFLLQTSILDRLNGPLCDAVTGQAGGKARLETLQRGNFFLIPLDDKRHWYRYHHLFAEVLYLYLMTEWPDQVPVLHSRASEWYEQNGSAADAICHAFAAQDFERAADLIELAAPAMLRSRQEATLLGCLKALPEGLFQARPVLSIEYVGALLSSGKIEGIEARLQETERWLDSIPDGRERPKDMVVMNEEEFRRLPGSIAMYHAAIALAHGDVANTMKYARDVLELAREDDYFMRGAASSILGLASWTSGDLETAHRIYSEGMAHLQRIGYDSDVVGGAVTLADIRITQGRLREAMSTYERGLQLATKKGVPALRGAADMHVGMGDLNRERNDLPSAMQHLMTSIELGEFNGLPKNPYRWRVAMARLHEVQGNLDQALRMLEEAERLYKADFSPNVRPVPAMKARVWVAGGRLGEAVGWARQYGLSADSDLSYLREFEHITLARLLLAQYKNSHSEDTLREAIGLLARLLNAAEEGGRMGSVIEICVLQSLAYQGQGDLPAAVIPLERALTLAEPEGYVRMFLDEGSRMEQLLREAAARRIVPGYASRLLGACNDAQHRSEDGSPSPASQSLIEPLSQRELEVLRLLKTELSGPEIATELVIALSTVRTHTESIYSKLNVNNRRAAVKRAAELGLI